MLLNGLYDNDYTSLNQEMHVKLDFVMLSDTEETTSLTKNMVQQ